MHVTCSHRALGCFDTGGVCGIHCNPQADGKCGAHGCPDVEQQSTNAHHSCLRSFLACTLLVLSFFTQGQAIDHLFTNKVSVCTIRCTCGPLYGVCLDRQGRVGLTVCSATRWANGGLPMWLVGAGVLGVCMRVAWWPHGQVCL
jgi:hypothetical protein